MKLQAWLIILLHWFEIGGASSSSKSEAKTTNDEELECYTCASKYFVKHWKALVPEIDGIPYRYFHKSYSKCDDLYKNRQNYRVKKRLSKCATRCFTIVKYDTVDGRGVLDGRSVARGCYGTLFPQLAVPSTSRYNLTTASPTTGALTTNATVIMCDSVGCNDDVHYATTTGKRGRRPRSGATTLMSSSSTMFAFIIYTFCLMVVQRPSL